MKQVYVDIPWIFVPSKVFALTEETYNSYSIAYGLTQNLYYEDYEPWRTSISIIDVKYAGLFGFIQDATIQNLGLESVIIKNVDYAASLAYSAKNSVITKVYSDNGGSSDSIVSASSSAGGLICYADDCIPLDQNNSKGGLYYSYNNVPVEITGPYAEGKSYVGGLIGRMRNSLI